MHKINNAVARAEYAVGTVMLISIILLVFLSAVLRLVDFPIVWSVDAAQLLFVWISMIGADLALKKGAHMGVDLLVRNFPGAVRNYLALFSYLLCLGFVVFMAGWGTHLCFMNYLRIYQTMNLSYSYATAAVPVLSILMFLTLAEQIASLLRNWKTPSVPAAGAPETNAPI